MDSGVVLGGKYRLEHPIGKGGMGEVWRARRLDLDADVAVKVMNLVAAEHEAAYVRFQREARAAAGLRSPHVVQIFDFGRDESTGTPFIAMELLEGESLRERLARERVLPPAVACEIIVQIGRALARAHAAQIVHRDLKPDNVFLVANDDQVLVKLLDFGIAKSEGRPGEALPTATGVLLGTPYYMSPEQLQSSRGVDGRTDLWSLCVIAYECLTGSKPFKAGTLPELAMRIALGRAEAPSRLAVVPLGFDEWFARGIEVDPERRFQSATALIDALRVVARETRMVGGAASDVALGATQAADTDSLSSQIAAARPLAEADTTHAAGRPVRRTRAALYIGAGLALLAALVGRQLLLSPDAAAPPTTAAGALSPPLQAPVATSRPAPSATMESVRARLDAPSATTQVPVVQPRAEGSAKREGASSKRREARDAAERRVRRARSKSAEPSAATPASAAPASAASASAAPRGVDAFDQQ